MLVHQVSGDWSGNLVQRNDPQPLLTSGDEGAVRMRGSVTLRSSDWTSMVGGKGCMTPEQVVVDPA